MERMDSEDFVVTEDNDATVEELSGDHSESRERALRMLAIARRSTPKTFYIPTFETD